MPVWQKRAVERAADLARDAQGAALGLGDVDRLDLGRLALAPLRRQPQQPLARAVDRDLLGDDLGPRQRVVLARASARSSLATSVMASKLGTPRT